MLAVALFEEGKKQVELGRQVESKALSYPKFYHFLAKATEGSGGRRG